MPSRWRRARAARPIWRSFTAADHRNARLPASRLPPMSALPSTLKLEATPSAEMGRRWRQRLGVLLAIAAVAEDLAIVYLGSVGDPRFMLDPSLITLGFLATVLTFPLMGALIVQRRPSTRVAWLMIGLGLSVGFGLFTYAYGVVGSPRAGPSPLALSALVASQLFFL